MAPLPKAVSSGRAIPSQDYIYLLGGKYSSKGEWKSSNWVQRYKVTHDVWEFLPDTLPYRGASVAGVWFHEQLIVLGGRDGESYLTHIFMGDKKRADLPTAGVFGNNVICKQGKLYSWLEYKEQGKYKIQVIEMDLRDFSVRVLYDTFKYRS